MKKCLSLWGIDMARIIINDLSFKSDAFSVKFIVRSGITVIGGDSSTFKTYYYDLMRRETAISNDTRFHFMNYYYNDSDRLIKGDIQNKIVFIDNADIIIPRDVRIKDMIADSNNQYIIFGRDVGRYTYSLDDLAELIQVNSQLVELSYVIKEAGVLWQ